MPKDILIRHLADADLDWLEATRPVGVTLNEHYRSVISAERRRSEDPQAQLFDTGTDPARVFASLPFTFIDLFAGIGGFRSALTTLGGTCVYSSEWDKYAAKTYNAWYGEEVDTRDIRTIDFNDIPNHDILAAGFPCQPFSLAGVSKKKSLGRPHGFDDVSHGNLFFSILDAIDVKHPPVVFLENVKNLRSHDGGNTWSVIQRELEDRGYHLFSKIVDAAEWVPQHRERIFIVGFAASVFGDRDDIGFGFPSGPVSSPRLGDILEDHVERKYMLSDKLWSYLQDYAAKHRAKGNGFGYGIADPNGHSRTISARYHKDGSEILIRHEGFRNPRRLTPGEARLLLGFDDRYAQIFGHDDGFPQVVSDTQAYRQFGNAVVPKVVEAIGESIVSTMAETIRRRRSGCLVTITN